MDTVSDVVRAGAEILVAGNAVFGKDDAESKMRRRCWKRPAAQVCSEFRKKLLVSWPLLKAKSHKANSWFLRFSMRGNSFVLFLGLLLALTVACTNKKAGQSVANVRFQAARQSAVRPRHGRHEAQPLRRFAHDTSDAD